MYIISKEYLYAYLQCLCIHPDAGPLQPGLNQRYFLVNWRVISTSCLYVISERLSLCLSPASVYPSWYQTTAEINIVTLKSHLSNCKLSLERPSMIISSVCIFISIQEPPSALIFVSQLSNLFVSQRPHEPSFLPPLDSLQVPDQGSCLVAQFIKWVIYLWVRDLVSWVNWVIYLWVRTPSALIFTPTWLTTAARPEILSYVSIY